MRNLIRYISQSSPVDAYFKTIDPKAIEANNTKYKYYLAQFKCEKMYSYEQVEMILFFDNALTCSLIK